MSVLKNILDALPKRENKKYVIDIGASTGGGPAFEFLINEEFAGLAIEYKEESAKKLDETIKKTNKNIKVICDKVTPINICEIFEKNGVPESPDLLKIDIDGYDLSVIREILKKYNPKIIIAEINEKIPPPIYFEVKYSDSYEWDYSHCFGFSLQAGKETIEPFGYTVASIIGANNILCIKNGLFKIANRSLKEIYETEYSKNVEVLPHFPWNADVHYWTSLTDYPEKLKSEIFDYFTKKNPRGKLIHPDAFILK